MSLEELQFKADQLSFLLDKRGTDHESTMVALRQEAQGLRRRLQTTLASFAKPKPAPPPDDSFVRSVEWRIQNVDATLRTMPRNQALWSPHFSVLGAEDMQLELFPRGRDTTQVEGFCALFLWCPPGVNVRYQLWMGKHRAVPDEDFYATRAGHGHSNFCMMEAHVDKETDSLLVGIDILELTIKEEVPDGLRLVNQAPEGLLFKEAGILRNQELNCVEWRIQNIAKRAQEVPRGLAMCSPLFSIAGVREMLLEFYPNGVHQGESDGKRTHCGFYVRCPSGNSLILTLTVGNVKKGPIRTDFDGNTAKGLPEFCALEEILAMGQEDLVVSVTVQNPGFENTDQCVYLASPQVGTVGLLTN